jgi:hypothetical protein
MPEMTVHPLSWGEGPQVFEAFLDPVCPFAAKAFPKLFELFDRVGPERMTLKLRLQPQPWLIFSGFFTRAIFAAATLPEGREAARRLMQTLIDRREVFLIEKNCGGPNFDITLNQLIDKLEAESGLALRHPFMFAELDKEVRWHVRYARQNGIHVTPSFMIDGLVRPEFGSGDEVDTWAEALGLAA